MKTFLKSEFINLRITSFNHKISFSREHIAACNLTVILLMNFFYTVTDILTLDKL